MTLTPLAQRLAAVAADPSADWLVLAENVPVWPDPPVLTAPAGSADDYRYAPSGGDEVLIEAICRRERAAGVRIGADSVLVTNGGFDGLALAARRARGAGVRRVLCAGPVLRSAAALFLANGLDVRVRSWPSVVGDRSRRELSLGPGDLVYLNSPHNPTGRSLTAGETDDLLLDARQRGFTVLLDLVYDSYTFEPDAVASPLTRVTDWGGVLAVNSFSKNWGAPGLRVGWLAAAAAVVAELTERFEHERIAVSSRAQRTAAQLCAAGNAPLRERVGEGHRLVAEWTRAAGLRAPLARGGTQAWMDLGVGDAERFADTLMADERLVLTTSANYVPGWPGYLRIPTGVPRPDLERALEAVDRTRRRVRRRA